MARVVDELITQVKFFVKTGQLKQGRDELGKFKKKLKITIHVLGQMRRAMIEAFAAKNIARGVGQLGGFIFKTNRSFEILQKRLQVVEGSAGRGAARFQEIVDVAVNTPATIEELTTSFTRLRAVGLKPTAEDLVSLSNTASANGKTVVQFAEAVADASTFEFERMKEFGIVARKEGDLVAITVDGITKRIAANAKTITNEFLNIGNTRFAGAAKAQMETLDGTVSNLKDRAQLFALAIGEGGLNKELAALGKTITKLMGAGKGLAGTIGQVLGDAVKSIREELEQLTAGDVEDFLRDVAHGMRVFIKAAKEVVRVVKFVVDNWKIFFSVVAGVKTIQGFRAVAVALEGIGLKATAALGPIGAIAAAFVALLPHAIDLGNAIGDVASNMTEVAKRQRLLDAQAGGRLSKRTEAVPFANKSFAEKITSKQRLIDSLTRKIDSESNRTTKFVLQKQLQANLRNLAQIREANRKAFAERERREGVIAGAQEESDEFQKSFHARRNLAIALRREFSGKRKSALIDEVTRDLATGKIDAATAEARLAAKPKKKGKGRRKAKSAKKGLEGDIESRIATLEDEAAQKAALQARLDDPTLTGSELIALSQRAGKARRQQLESAVASGNIEALGGKFSRSNQLLAAAGLGDLANRQTPPVITINITRIEVSQNIDAPIDMRGVRLNATMGDVTTGLAPEISKQQQQAAREAAKAIQGRQQI